ncbi:57_t:CDS:2, partial [Cetraspora pellucida]
MFDKISVVITDNVSSINKAIRQLGTPHLGCIAHIIHFAVTDGLKQCKTLIGCAKSLNNFLVNCDKYRSLFRKIQHEIIEKKNNDNATKLTTNMSVLDPISSDTITRWNSTYFVLQRLLELQKPILELATNLTNNPDRTIRADVLDQIEYTLTNLEAIEMHQSLRMSMFVTFLDPRFKTLSTASPTIQKEVIKELRKKIKLSNQKNTLTTTNQALDTEMFSFFDDGVEPSSLSRIDMEFQVYFSISPIP